MSDESSKEGRQKRQPAARLNAAQPFHCILPSVGPARGVVHPCESSSRWWMDEARGGCPAHVAFSTASPPRASMSMCWSRQLRLYSEDDDDTGPKRTTGAHHSSRCPSPPPPSTTSTMWPKRSTSPVHSPQLLPPHLWRHNGAEEDEGQRVSVLSLHLQLAHIHRGLVRRHLYLRLHRYSALLPANLGNTVERGQVRRTWIFGD
ncbi:hypothetical protein B0H13DRAFT_2673042 [Mycena leptocephala]|nr:hypothetical protein B0H13DRAFT_2673042 [Mycena leptocephala]